MHRYKSCFPFIHPVLRTYINPLHKVCGEDAALATIFFLLPPLLRHTSPPLTIIINGKAYVNRVFD